MIKVAGLSRVLRPLFFVFVPLFFGLVLAFGYSWWHLPPAVSDWEEIYSGVYYLSKNVEDEKAGLSGRIMAIKVDLLNPDVQVVTRQMDQEAEKEGGHYVLTFPDYEVYAKKLSVLISTTPFSGRPSNVVARVGRSGEKRPFRGFEGYPGRTVWSTMPVVSEGRPTHVPRLSKLLWFDRNKKAHLASSQMSSEEFLSLLRKGSIEYGVGFEVLHVINGRVDLVYNREKFKKKYEMRPFIGIDRLGRFLYLIASESSSRYGMAKMAAELGVDIGGQMDAGNTTWLIVGEDPKGIRPLTGIRGGRPIGAYLAIKSKPIR